MIVFPLTSRRTGKLAEFEKPANIGFEPVQILLADFLRQNDVINEPLDQLREGEIMRRELPHRRDRDAGGQAGIDPGHEGFQLRLGSWMRMSANSPRLSMPTAVAPAKEIRGWGWNPWE